MFYLRTRKGLEIPASLRASSNQVSAAWLGLFSWDTRGGGDELAGPLTGTRTAGSVFFSVLQLSIKHTHTSYTIKTHMHRYFCKCVNPVTRGFRGHTGRTFRSCPLALLSPDLVLFL